MKNSNLFFCFKREDTTRFAEAMENTRNDADMYVVNLQSGLYHSGYPLMF